MSTAPLRVAFAAASAVTALAGALERRGPLALAKGSLMPLLGAEVLTGPPESRDASHPSTPGARGDRGDRALLLTALLGAWSGDLLLLPPSGGEGAPAPGRPVADPGGQAGPAGPASTAAERRRLRRGAAAFAVQQSGYLALLVRRGHRPRARVALPVAAWLAALAVLDARGGAEGAGGPDPVVTGYGVLLGAMAATALSSRDPRLVRGGAAFLASDSAILLRERLLRGPLARGLAEALVLASYTDAQRYLVDGFSDR